MERIASPERRRLEEEKSTYFERSPLPVSKVA
jgi:hypothetical protein